MGNSVDCSVASGGIYPVPSSKIQCRLYFTHMWVLFVNKDISKKCIVWTTLKPSSKVIKC